MICDLEWWLTTWHRGFWEAWPAPLTSYSCLIQIIFKVCGNLTQTHSHASWPSFRRTSKTGWELWDSSWALNSQPSKRFLSKTITTQKIRAGMRDMYVKTERISQHWLWFICVHEVCPVQKLLFSWSVISSLKDTLMYKNGQKDTAELQTAGAAILKSTVVFCSCDRESLFPLLSRPFLLKILPIRWENSAEPQEYWVSLHLSLPLSLWWEQQLLFYAKVQLMWSWRREKEKVTWSNLWLMFGNAGMLFLTTHVWHKFTTYGIRSYRMNLLQLTKL